MPKFCNVYPQIEKGCIEKRAMKLYAVMHFHVGLRWWCVDINELKILSISEFADVDMSGGSDIYSIDNDYLFLVLSQFE